MFLAAGKNVVTPNHAYIGPNKIDLAKDTNTVYTHPTDKVCTGGDCTTLSGYTYQQIINSAASQLGDNIYITEYTGNDTKATTSQSFTLPHTPRVVIVFVKNGVPRIESNLSRGSLGVVTQENPTVCLNNIEGREIITLSGNIITVSNKYNYQYGGFNESSIQYVILSIK